MSPIPRTMQPRRRMAALLTSVLLPAAGAALAAGPVVTSVQPIDGSTGVARASTIVATFDQTLSTQAGSNALTLVCDGTPVAGTLSVTGNQLQLTPSALLPSGRQCTASIAAEGVSNPDGQTNAGASTWAFRTIVKTRTLTVTRAGTGSGTVIGAGSLPSLSGRLGIDCGEKCDARVLAGNRYVLEARPVPGSSFARWVGCPQPDGNRCVIPSMDRDREVSARFQPAALPAELSFRTVQTPVTSSLFAVAYGNGVLVAGGEGRSGPGSTAADIKGYYTLMYSTDMGETWQHSAPLQPLNDSVNPRDTHLLWVIFNGSQFLAFEQNYSDPFVSTDGINWTRGQRPVLSSGESVANVVWCGNRYVVLNRAGRYATSADGLTWASHTGSPLLAADVSVGCLPNGDLLVTSRYVPNAQPAAMWTLGANGTTWTALDSTRTLGRASTFEPIGNYNVGFDAMGISPDGRIVAIPRPDGRVYAAPASVIGTSLTNWFRAADPAPAVFSRVAWTGAFFEATQFDGAVSRSSNGTRWTPMQASGVRTVDRASEGGIPFVRIGNRLVVVGAFGQVAIGTP